LRARRGLRPHQVASLARAVRWASVPTWIDRASVSKGFALDPIRDEVVVVGRFERDGIEAIVGLPRDGELCRTVFLHREVVLRERAGLSPSGESHLAVVIDRRAQDPGAVRTDEALDLVRSGRGRLYEEAARRYGSLAPGEAAVVRRLLLRRGARQRTAAGLEGLPLFLRLDGAPADVAGVVGAAADRMVWAVAPSM